MEHLITSQEPSREHLLSLKDRKDLRAKLREENIRLTKKDISQSVRPDRHIIQAIATLEEIDRVVNALAKRLRDWYALYWPELERQHPGHRAFLAAIRTAGERPEESMGGDCTESDRAMPHAQAGIVERMYEQRDALVKYLDEIMHEHTPNLRAVAGTTIGAKLLALAGSLDRLGRMPSGTIQLLGAETALFRHLRTRARAPKHGVIFNHQLVQRARNRGRAARALADNIAIAARVDLFKGEFVGDRLYTRVEGRL